MKQKITALLVAVGFAGAASAQPYTVAQEQDRLINLAMTPELAVELTNFIGGGSGITAWILPNNIYGKARNAAGTANIDVLKVDATDDTILNADTGDVIGLAVAGTTEVSIDNDLLAFSGTAPTIQSAGSLIFKMSADAQRLITYAAASDTAFTEKWGDGGVTAAQQLTISASTADADDDSSLFLSAGGAYANDGTRGGGIRLSGNEDGNGDTVINAGSVSGGDLVASAPAANGNFYVQTAGTNKWTVSSTGTLIGGGTASIGWSYVTGANTACTTTCTAPAVFGVDLAAGASQPVIVDASSATADACLCAGAS